MTKTKTTLQGKENGVPPVVKVETITDSQVPSLLDKAIKFCQMKIKVGILKKKFHVTFLCSFLQITVFNEINLFAKNIWTNKYSLYFVKL